ncbi:MAG TPA: YraN family protein [bacterium (Candidatus Stahlbacteria)]|nr:YraN family protein [Candidatus Stahlbacteria bacterium]
MSQRDKGQRGEDSAVGYLKRHGFEILLRNFRTRRGEIDIIARNKEGIRFIEVRMRKDDSLVLPQETIIKKKKKRIISAAREYLSKEHLFGKEDCHFDVIAIDGDDIDYIPDAFSVDA